MGRQTEDSRRCSPSFINTNATRAISIMSLSELQPTKQLTTTCPMPCSVHLAFCALHDHCEYALYSFLIRKKVVLVRWSRSQRRSNQWRPLRLINLPKSIPFYHGRRNLKLRFSLLKVRRDWIEPVVTGFKRAEFAVKVGCYANCYAGGEDDEEGAHPGCLLVGD